MVGGKKMRKQNWAILAIASLLIFGAVGCDEDSAAEAAKNALCDELGLVCDEDAVGVDTPDGWYFLFAKDLDGDQSSVIDQELEIPQVGTIVDLLGVDEDDLDQMIAVAKVEAVDGFGNRLRYANKVIYDDGTIKLDSETMEKLGDSIGSSGAGMYAFYFSMEQNGFISGEVKDCSGSAKSGILVTASDSPFFTYTGEDAKGGWALPSLSGKPASVHFTDGDDCQGETSAPSTDTEEDPNPKFEDDFECGDPNPPCPVDDTPPADDFGDGTDNVDTGENDMEDSPPEEDLGDLIDFEDDALGNGAPTGWQFTGDCDIFGVSDQAYGALFPGGDEDQYMYISSGGNNVQSCTATVTVPVPSGATSMEISYNFVSQEYEEWVGSAYNDIFTVIVQGSPIYAVNRSVNNVATSDDWMDLTGDAVTIAEIGTSDDAYWNDNSMMFDGGLKGGDGESNPRGAPVNDNLGNTASVPLPEDFASITIIATVSDVADAIYDSAGLIDWIEFK
jgi:hypothetical protein